MRRIVGARLVNPVVGWGLAALAVAAGYVGWGWPGVALALTVVVFWLLLQFSRAMRVLRAAGRRPVGRVDSAIMFNSRLAEGMQMMQVIGLTKSLGEKVSEAGGIESWLWRDSGGDAVRVELRDGRVMVWQLERAGPAQATGAPQVPT
jgi:hypothetical protein